MSATNTLLRANLRSHGRRYISTGLAVAISSAFIIITLVVMTALTGGLSAGVYSRYRGGTILVEQGTDAEADSASRAEAALRATPGVTAIKHLAQWPADVQTDSTRGRLYVSPLAPDPFTPPDLTAGSRPTADDQVALPESTASSLKVTIGDTLRIRAGFAEGAFTTVTVVGTTRSDSFSGGIPTTYVTDGGFSSIFGTTAGAFLVATSSPDTDSNANPSQATQETWVATTQSKLSGIPGMTVTSVHEKINDDLKQAQLGAAAMMAIMMAFPAIAALVASIVVSSTFRVVLTQRTRELALLRILGATRRQVRSLVTREAFAIGAISSAIGVACGALIGVLAVVGTGLADSFTSALASLSILQVVGTWLGATIFTTFVGIFPARAASRVAPVAALAPVNETGAAARKKHTVRFVLGLLIAAGGITLVTVAWRMADASQKFLGSFGGSLLALIGALLAISVLLPALTRGFGIAFPGTLAAMARENTTRNPGRTSATGAAIIIGVTLVVTIMVGAASMRTTLTNAVNSARPFDLIAVSTTGTLTDDQRATIAGTEGVAAIADQYSVSGTLTTTSGAPAYKTPGGSGEADMDSAVMIIGQPDYAAVAHSSVTQIGDDQVSVGEESLAGQTLRLCGSTCVDLTAVHSKRTDYGKATVSESTLRRIADPVRQAVIIKLADGANVEAVQAALLKDSSLSVSGSALERQVYLKTIDKLMIVLVGLLGVSVLVSLVGVANTLSLSVAERTRENGLLRALGLTRRQMKGLLALEALFLSLTGALIGLALGTGFGWVGIKALPIEGATPVLTVPWVQLAAVCAIAVLSALVASWLPGRRAARVSPSEALATE